MEPSRLFGQQRYVQYLSSIIASFSMASAAMHLLWSSPVLPQLTSANSPIGTTITASEASWVASSVILGTLPGAVVSSYLVEKIGRKAALLFSTIPLALPWFAIAFANSFIELCIFRFIAGIGFSIAMGGGSMYIGEIAENDIRGKLGTMLNILRLMGGLYVLSVGPFISYVALTLSCSALPMLFGILIAFMPESPYYLVKVGKKELARKNLERLSSASTDANFIDIRMKEIENVVEADMKNRTTIWEFISKKDYRKSLIIIIGVKTIQQMSGQAAIEPYTQTIIEASDSSISPELSSVITGVIQIPAALLASFLVDKMGRKPLMIISTLGCAVALFSEGIYFYFRNSVQADVKGISWLPTTGLVLYFLMNPIGVTTLPMILLGELFSTNIKGVAVSLTTFYGSCLSFGVSKLFQPISDAWGMHVSFWIFAVTCTLGAIFSLTIQPETKGKTFAEIQNKLKKNLDNCDKNNASS